MFSVNDVQVLLKEGELVYKGDPTRSWGQEDEFSDGETFVESYGLEKKLEAAVTSIDETFDDIEDVLEATFGDGMQVTVHRNGKIEVDEYDHD